MTLNNEIYEYLNETVRHEPNYVKVMQWAVGLHFNSSSTKDGVSPAKIGYYFTTVFFKDWKWNYEPKDGGRPVQLALFYTGTYKTRFASTGAEDVRPYTIVYAIDDVDGIKQDIKSNYQISDIFTMDEPRPNYQDDNVCYILHKMAEKYVRYVKVYWKNNEADAITIPQTKLDNLGTILKNSNLNISSTVIDKTRTRKTATNDNRCQYACYVTIPLDQKTEFNRLIYNPYVNQPYLEIKVEDKTQKEGFRIIHAPKVPSSSQIRTVKDENNNLLYIGIANDEWGTVMRKLINRAGFTEPEDWKPISLLNASGTGVRRETPFYSALEQVLDEIIHGKYKERKPKKPRGNGGTSGEKTGGTTSLTIAADAADFQKIVTLATAKVNVYKSSHPKSKAKLTKDDNAQSITIDNMSQDALDSLCAFFDKKNLQYSKM